MYTYGSLMLSIASEFKNLSIDLAVMPWRVLIFLRYSREVATMFELRCFEFGTTCFLGSHFGLAQIEESGDSLSETSIADTNLANCAFN